MKKDDLVDMFVECYETIKEAVYVGFTMDIESYQRYIDSLIFYLFMINKYPRMKEELDRLRDKYQKVNLLLQKETLLPEEASKASQELQFRFNRVMDIRTLVPETLHVLIDEKLTYPKCYIDALSEYAGKRLALLGFANEEKEDE